MIRVASNSRGRKELSCGVSCYSCTTRIALVAAVAGRPVDQDAEDSDPLALARPGDHRLGDRGAMAVAVGLRASRAIASTTAIAAPSRRRVSALGRLPSKSKVVMPITQRPNDRGRRLPLTLPGPTVRAARVAA